ncbi:adenine phosphoribosyltransferase [Lyngbya confervoides]|uniref:Adenine phosphoribosyltransferase n=1 Tax=Lyngbya confervoides BDU141951 TaxID=1574623 RepID=A0ABD4T1G2_9CYAN|nr:adenine phosphoribosyltransferase [Lyngbya confervoides]MCM1982479.1 adenine phosphoribosyltransferase [Lyngbya confervoides BDU141951]
MDLKALIREIPDFPKPGILFRDITTLLQSPEGLSFVIEQLVHRFDGQGIDYVAGIESRGFLFGTPLACRLSAGFVPVRKPGKLPAEVHSMSYDLEYGTDALEIHQDALRPQSRVLIVDDLLATGGTAQAAAKLVQKTQAQLVGFAFIIELEDLGGRQKLDSHPVMSLIQY